jgi:phage shock protein E
MGFFDLFTQTDINKELESFHATEEAVLLDVRTKEEYRTGHIPESINIPLDRIAGVARTVPDKDTPLFVYCQSGGRSAQAVTLLKQMGYRKVKNIGGILSYKGKAVT